MAIHNCRPSNYIMYNRIMDHHRCGSFNTGDTYNIKFNCNGGHTGFWGGFGAGLGMGFGNFVGGLFGNVLGNLGFGTSGLGTPGFGMGGFGFGMPSWGGWNSGLSGLWGGNGASRIGNSGSTDYVSKYGSSSSSTCNCRCCDKDKSSVADATDADCGKIAGFIGELKNLKTPVDQKTYDDLKNRITDAQEASKNDPKNKAANLKAYEGLLESLEKYNPATSTPVVPTPVEEAPVEEEKKAPGNGKVEEEAVEETTGFDESNWDINDVPANLKNTTIELPTGYIKISNDDSIEDGTVERAHDSSGSTVDVVGASTVSKSKYNNTNYPMYIRITTSSENNYDYKCIGMSGGYPVYATPKTDENDNVYILVKNGNGKFELIQLDENFKGYDKKDTQCG